MRLFLIELLIIAVIALWLLKLLIGFLLPTLFQTLLGGKPTNQRYQSFYQTYKAPVEPEGTVHVDYIPPKDREAKLADKIGEFIDYEEIKNT